MAGNSTQHFSTVSNEALITSVIFKFIAMGVGVTGNVAVIIFKVFLENEKTATSYLVANLAVADLLVCLTFYPIWIIEFIRTMLDVDSDQDLFCKASRSSLNALLFVSIATLFAITVDRYFFIVKPLKYPMIVSRRRIIPVMVGSWLIGCVVFYISQLYFRKNEETPRRRSFCYLSKSVGWFLQVFVVYIPLLLIFSLNFKMLSVARKQRKRILAETNIFANNSNKHSGNAANGLLRLLDALKSAKTFLIVVAVLAFCCIVPAVVGPVLYNRKCSESCLQLWYVVFQYELYGINSIVNPIIYGVRHVKYRNAYGRIFKILLCKRDRSI